MTGKDGRTTFKGVSSGYYQIKETKTPTGYIITGDDCFYIKVDGTRIELLEKVIGQDGSLSFKKASGNTVGNVTLTSDSTKVTFEVINEPGKSLPFTGGIGTKAFHVIGSILILGAGAVLPLRRRRII